MVLGRRNTTGQCRLDCKDLPGRTVTSSAPRWWRLRRIIHGSCLALAATIVTVTIQLQKAIVAEPGAYGSPTAKVEERITAMQLDREIDIFRNKHQVIPHPEMNSVIRKLRLSKPTTIKQEQDVKGVDLNEKTSRELCCNLLLFDNSGHAFTENVLDLYHCKPVVAFRNNLFSYPFHAQFVQIAKILGATQSSNQTECDQYYERNPSSSNGNKTRIAAYSRMAIATGAYYDGLEVARALRDAQEKVLRSCGMEPPQLSSPDSEDHYSLPASRSVIIVVRHPMRKFLNSEQVLELCQGLGLRCSVFDANQYFDQPESDDICRVLHQFQDNPVVIGVQGAELFYPIFLGSRLLLMPNVNQFDVNSTYSFRIGNKTRPGEEIVALNLLRNGNTLFDWYYLEFAAIFGSELMPVLSSVDLDSVERARQSSKNQCKTGSFCGDRTADLEHTRRKLLQLIEHGKLLTNLRNNGNVQERTASAASTKERNDEQRAQSRKMKAESSPKATDARKVESSPKAAKSNNVRNVTTKRTKTAKVVRRNY